MSSSNKKVNLDSTSEEALLSEADSEVEELSEQSRPMTMSEINEA
ncbi:hypothetical protein [Streptacidiphilus melanogenes]|nr:hypothetical protein [Streptacidiphilus melanogenes]